MNAGDLVKRQVVILRQIRHPFWKGMTWMNKLWLGRNGAQTEGLNVQREKFDVLHKVSDIQPVCDTRFCTFNNDRLNRRDNT